VLLPIAKEPLLPSPFPPPALNADRLFPVAPPGSKDVCIDDDELDEAADEEPDPAKDEPLPVNKSFFMPYTSVCSDFVVSLRKEGMMLPKSRKNLVNIVCIIHKISTQFNLKTMSAKVAQ